MEPPHSYVYATSTSVVHHEDYLNSRNDQALCGAALKNPTPQGPASRPVAVCPDCEAKVAEYHLKWWRDKAEAATAELEGLRVKYRELAEYVDDQRRQVTGVEPPTRAAEDPSGEKPESRREQDETTPTPFLDRARKELLELCRQADETVPYWRVKNSMEAFRDTLEPDERVLLAREIGADGSLIRWCTREIEGLGWRVTNNPVHGDADAMMDAWTQDLYQTPKKTKWRLGRSRSHDGS
ncbi:MAG TPA: hypothetical protein VJ777_16660 [Mycobacterium sp.]|nr:hypothetical protein [Mycobacterium sp.]